MRPSEELASIRRVPTHSGLRKNYDSRRRKSKTLEEKSVHMRYSQEFALSVASMQIVTEGEHSRLSEFTWAL
jgi:hypothetical protein